MVTTWADLRAQAEAHLRDAHVLRPDTEARWMVERVSGYDGAELVTNEQELADRAGGAASRRPARAAHGG